MFWNWFLDLDEKIFLGDSRLPHLEGQLFVEYEDAVAVAASFLMEESSTPSEKKKSESSNVGRKSPMEESSTPIHSVKKKPGRRTAGRKPYSETRHKINLRERKRMNEMSR